MMTFRYSSDVVSLLFCYLTLNYSNKSVQSKLIDTINSMIRALAQFDKINRALSVGSLENFRYFKGKVIGLD